MVIGPLFALNAARFFMVAIDVIVVVRYRIATYRNPILKYYSCIQKDIGHEGELIND